MLSLADLKISTSAFQYLPLLSYKPKPVLRLFLAFDWLIGLLFPLSNGCGKSSRYTRKMAEVALYAFQRLQEKCASQPRYDEMAARAVLPVKSKATHAAAKDLVASGIEDG
jgi:hypothetical protein